MSNTQSKPTRILFLDIDGVLNRTVYGEDTYFDFMPAHRDMLEAPDVPLFKDQVNNLKKIIGEVPDIGIVWSTDWRFEKKEKYFSWDNPRLYLEKQSWFNDRLIGMTPKRMSSNRSEEIHFWFNENDFAKKHKDLSWLEDQSHFIFFRDKYYDISNYAILDDFDDPGMIRYGRHFFKTNPENGLTSNMADKLISFLQTDDFNLDDIDWRKQQR